LSDFFYKISGETTTASIPDMIPW